MCARARACACVHECTLTTNNTDHTISEKTQIKTNNTVRLKSCHTHLSSLLQPICYCAQTIEACCVTYMIMVIDARISNNADQQILSNLFKDIKCSLSQPVTSCSQNTLI